jgi:hypothetical protein
VIPRWRPLPSLAALDARIRGVSHEARGVFMLLVCSSDVDGVVRYAGPVRHAVDALAGESASISLDELVEAQLVDIDCEGELVLPDVPRWQAENAPLAPSRRAPEPSTRDDHDEATDDASPLDRRTAGRRLAKQWTRRGLKDTDAKLRWLSTEQGRAYLETSGITFDLARAIATGDATPPATPPATLSATPRHPAAPESATPNATPPAALGSPPVPPSGEKTREEQRKALSTASARDATPPATLSATPRHPAAPESATPRPSVGEAPDTAPPSIGESSRSFSSLLFDLAKQSDGRFAMAGSVDQQEDVATVFRESGLSDEALLSALRCPSKALAGFEMVTRNNFVSVAMLAGKRGADGRHPCDAAHSLVAYVRAQAAAPIEEPYGMASVPTVEETRAANAGRLERQKRGREVVAKMLSEGWRPPPLKSRATEQKTEASETQEATGG